MEKSQIIILVLFAALIVVAISVFVAYKLKQKKNVSTTTEEKTDELSITKSTDINRSVIPAEIPRSLAITVEPLTPQNINADKLVEIKDKKLVGRVAAIVPQIGNVLQNANVAQGVANANAAIGQANKAIEEVKEVAKAGELYRVIIPKGAKLVNDRSMDGANRGMYVVQKVKDTVQGKKTYKFTGQADLVKVDPDSIESIKDLPQKFLESGAVNSVMNVASAVVGQYYMAQVSSQLDDLNEGIDKVATFQETEYKSRVTALIAQVNSLAEFTDEILINEEIRNRTLHKVDDVEHECIELLQQANYEIEKLIDSDAQKYDDYAKITNEANGWYEFHLILSKVLEEIATLKYTLNKGQMSPEMCQRLCVQYASSNAAIEAKLAQWHNTQSEKLGVDVEALRRKRMGFDGVIHKPLALFKDDFNYKKISREDADKIGVQSGESNSNHSLSNDDLFNSDVTIIEKDGKLYYLPESNED